MPHYDPRKHKTNDVVRHVVIPCSRFPDGSGGLAYADMLRVRQHLDAAAVGHHQHRHIPLMDGLGEALHTAWHGVRRLAHELHIEGPDWVSRTGPGLHVNDPRPMPERMVTHAWDNLFAHLVAAICADALDAEDYSLVAYTMSLGDVDAIRNELRSKGALGRRYWICAFCVNQHTGICGGFGAPPPAGGDAYSAWDAKRRDTVTAEVYPQCNCSQPKYFNDSPGLCEMDKFDAMMAYLAGNEAEFCQVVAVDRGFGLFTRAWCVAELVEASATGIPQRVQVYNRRQLDICAADTGIYLKLALLTVAECEASRPEDKEAIIAKIPDITEFDVHLQRIIFGEQGLLQQHFSGLGLLDAAVRTARRIQALSTEAELRAARKAASVRPPPPLYLVAVAGPDVMDL